MQIKIKILQKMLTLTKCFLTFTKFSIKYLLFIIFSYLKICKDKTVNNQRFSGNRLHATKVHNTKGKMHVKVLCYFYFCQKHNTTVSHKSNTKSKLSRYQFQVLLPKMQIKFENLQHFHSNDMFLFFFSYSTLIALENRQF